VKSLYYEHAEKLENNIESSFYVSPECRFKWIVHLGI